MIGIAMTGCKHSEPHALVDGTSGRFHVGERWSYKTRPGEEGSQITVVKIDSNPSLGVILHVSIDGLRIRNPTAPGGYADKIGHMPMAEAAVDKSVTTMVSESATLPNFQDGYDQWRAAFDQGKAGVFTVTIAEAVGSMEAVLNK